MRARPGSTRPSRGLTLGLAAVGLAAAARTADAQIYRYEKDDGTTVFTDQLSDLPPERRAFYNRKAEAARERLEAIEASMTPAERRRAELQAERERVATERQDAEARAEHLAELDAALRRLERQARLEALNRRYWQERVAKARAELKTALARYREARKAWEALAIQPRFTLFPGQAERRIELEEQLPKLAAAVEAANEALTETLPAKARKAGVPPGWLR